MDYMAYDTKILVFICIYFSVFKIKFCLKQ